MPKQHKIDAVVNITERLDQASALYFLDFTKVRANDLNQLRQTLRELGVRVQVVKNRLAQRALAESGAHGDFGGLLRGPTSVVYAAEDPVAPARALLGIAKRLTELKVKGAYVDQVIYTAEQFQHLATLPTRAELRVQLVAMLEAPIMGLALGLEGLIGELVYVFDRLAEEQSGLADEPAA